MMYLHMQQLMSPSLRLVVDTTKASCMPQLMSCVFDQTDQHTSHVCWSSGSCVNINATICRLKHSLLVNNGGYIVIVHSCSGDKDQLGALACIGDP